MKANAKVISGNLIFDRVADFYRSLSVFDGQEVEVEIRKRKKNRSQNQNRFYWGVFLPAVKSALIDIGYWMANEEQVHDLLKLKFLKTTSINENTGEVMEILGTTTDMSTTDFEMYLTQVRVWAAEYLGATLPVPNEQE